MKKSLSRRLVSAHDEDAETGISALAIAVIGSNLTIIRLLLGAGADPFQGPNLERTAVSNLLLHFHLDNPATAEIAALFPMSALLDDFEYADLHRVVLGLLPLDLEAALRASPRMAAQVNHETRSGYTPAALAAMRGDVAALAALARAGADLRRRCRKGLTPLHLACQGGHVAAAEFLLDCFSSSSSSSPSEQEKEEKVNGGQVTTAVDDPTTWRGESPLRMVYKSPRAGHTRAVVDALLARGADVDARNRLGETALKGAVQQDCHEDVAYLLARGADPSAVDVYGNTPLIEAAFFGHARCARALLAHGADVTCVSARGEGILHFLAACADEDTVQAFLDADDIGWLDATLRDREGRTPRECLQRCAEAQDGVREKFQRLLDRMERSGSQTSAEEASDDDGSSDSGYSLDDDFFDAVENWTN